MTAVLTTHLIRGRADASTLAAPPPVAVQILGLLLFAGFAVVATSLGFVFFWPAGFVLALAFGWIGFGRFHAPLPLRPAAAAADPAPARPAFEPSGNASFDAYRSEIIARLESERESFAGFMNRLRDAKDRSEFETFMEDRARAVAAQAGERAPEAAVPLPIPASAPGA